MYITECFESNETNGSIKPGVEIMISFKRYIIQPITFFVQVKYSEGHLVSGPDSHPTRWMRFVAAAHDEHEQNLSAVRSPEGRVMFRTTRSILRGEELLVWYTSGFAEYLGIPTSVNRYRGKINRESSYVCWGTLC